MPSSSTGRAVRLDLAIAAAVAVLSVVHATASAAPGDQPSTWALVVLVTGSASLIARRRAPMTVLVVTTISVVLYATVDRPGMAGVAVLVAIYTAVEAGHRWPTIGVVGAGLAAGVVHTVSTGGSLGRTMAETLLLKGWLLASGVLAETVRKQRALADQAERRAEAAEQARAETARREAGEERLRIARELHDSLTHSISIISVQANVAVHLARKRGDDVPPALLAIQDASTQAARELRSTLEVLRHGADATRVNLARLPELIAGAGRAGVTATLTIDGQPSALPPDVDGAAYRIVQEALTNVARHAGPASAAVRVRYDPHALTVEIDDDGPAPSGPTPGTPPPPGVGLTGMRERVDALGGQIVAGPRPRGGFRVRALLPLRPAEQPGALA